MSGPLTIVELPEPFLARYTGLDHEPADTQAQRSGRCYELACHAHLTWAALGWETTLVHGTIHNPELTGGTPPNPHGWVEFRAGGRAFAWEPISDTVVPVTEFQRSWGSRRWATYRPGQARRLVLEHRHYGVWGRAHNARYEQATAAMEAHFRARRETAA